MSTTMSTSWSGSSGFARCRWKPAAADRSRSRSPAYAVTAIAIGVASAPSVARDLPQERVAVGARHADVADQHLRMLLDGAARAPRRPTRREDRRAGVLEHRARASSASGSSSTTRMRQRRASAAARRRAGATRGGRRRRAGALTPPARGSRTVNVAPRPAPSLDRVDGAAVQLDELPHDREPEAEPAVLRACSTRRPGGSGRRRRAGTPARCRCRCRRRTSSSRSPARLSVTATRPPARRELHRVRQQVPDDLLQPIGIAERRPALGRARRVSMVDLPRLGRGTDRLDGRVARAPRGRPARRSRRSLPAMMRETSSRSSTSRACALRVALDRLERRCRDRRSATARPIAAAAPSRGSR